MLKRTLSSTLALAIAASGIIVSAPAYAADYPSVASTPSGVVAALTAPSDRHTPALASAPAIPPGSKAASSRRMLVELSPGVSQARLRAAGNALGYRVVQTLPQIGWAVVTPKDAHTSAATVGLRTKRAKLATRVRPEAWMQAAYTPSDPYYQYQWGFENNGVWGGTRGMDARMPAAWDWSRGKDVVAAVVDTGVDFSNPDLAGQQWVNSDEIAGNGVDDDGNGYIDDVNGWDFYRAESSVFDAVDGDKHGTHVAGTIAAATDNGIGGAGTAPQARVMSLKFLGPMGGSDANGAAAIIYAANNGADVINASWGGTTGSAVMADALAYAASKGVLVVCAAGNNGTNNDTTPFYPAAFPATNVVSVAALDRYDGLASYSNRGATSVDLGAPGDSILSAQPVLGASLYAAKDAYRVVYHAFPVESIDDVSARDALILKSMDRLGATPSTPVMIVDDSWPTASGETAGARASAYTSALAKAGYSSVSTWATNVSGIPSAATLSGKTVIWFTGASTFRFSPWNYYGTFSSTERTTIGTYLTGGGRILISSGEVGADTAWIGGSALTWYRTYLHAALVDDDPWTYKLTDREPSPGAPSTLTLTDSRRGTNGCDDVRPYDGYAQTIADWDGQAVISGTSMAAPHVTGTIALMRARMRNASAADLKERLLMTTRPTAALSGVTVSGGALDAAAAVGRLAAPASFSATAGVMRVDLSWANGQDSDFALTRVLARSDAVPTGPEDPAATVAYEGSGTSASLTGLAPGTVHYAAYSRNALGTWTEGAFADASPLSPVVDDSYTMRWNRALKVAAPGLLGNDLDPAGVATLVTPSAHGTATVGADGAFTYTPQNGYFGADSFTYRLGNSPVATVTIDVRRYRVDSLTPSKAVPGTPITFTGTGFGPERGTGSVKFGKLAAEVVSWSDTSITAIAPVGCVPSYAGVVQDGVVSNGVWFTPTPKVETLSVTSGAPGTLVTFTGAGFGLTQGSGSVTFAGTQATVIAWSDTSVTAMVPAGASAGYAGVVQNGVSSNGIYFRPYARPTLDALSARHGVAGTSVTLTGRGFGATQGDGIVRFAGVNAVVTAWSDTSVTAIVPAGAASGYVGVSRYGLMSNGLWFDTIAGPHIDALSASSAPAGDAITITGSGFGAAQGTGWVTFGGAVAHVVSWSDTSVTAIVPINAPAGYVGVAQGGIMSNGKYFTPKP